MAQSVAKTQKIAASHDLILRLKDQVAGLEKEKSVLLRKCAQMRENFLISRQILNECLTTKLSYEGVIRRALEHYETKKIVWSFIIEDREARL